MPLFGIANEVVSRWNLFHMEPNLLHTSGICPCASLGSVLWGTPGTNCCETVLTVSEFVVRWQVKGKLLINVVLWYFTTWLFFFLIMLDLKECTWCRLMMIVSYEPRELVGNSFADMTKCFKRFFPLKGKKASFLSSGWNKPSSFLQPPITNPFSFPYL